jgi:Histidine kinase-, DNA gyrase B-, and HSP90-like ATPase
MIPEKEKAYEIQSNLAGTKHQMGIAQEAMEHIMDMLANAYPHPKQAVLREYSTNAHDAHVEAGVTDPIEVELPGPLSQALKIRDYGIGLSEQDIHDIYSQYGASTKRGTNALNGMLGIGCKSGLAYCNQFTLVSRKDGEQITAIVSRTGEGGGVMEVLERVPTPERDGTEIVLPAQRGDDFVKEAKELFAGWPKGSVLVNGREPERYDGLWVSDDLCVIEGDYYNSESILVMGNVPYPIDPEYFNPQLPDSGRLVAWVPIGSVKFAPSREELRYTDLTKETLAGVQEKFFKACEDRVQAEIDKAANPAEARKTMISWHNKLPRTARAIQYFYKGEAIPSAFSAEGGKTLVTTDKSGYRLSHHSKGRPVPVESFGSALFVQNYDRPTFTPGQKKKLNFWMESQNGAAPDGVRMYVLYEGKIDSKWIGKDRIIEWADVDALKLPRTLSAAKATGSSGRIPGSYDFFEDSHDGWRAGVPGDDIDQSKPIFYYEGSPWDYNYAQALALDHDKFVLVRLTANRIEKFCRLFPTAEKVQRAVKRNGEAWWKTLSETEKFAFKVRDSHRAHRYENFDPAKIDDPNLKKIVKAAKTNLTKLQDKRSTYNSAGAGLTVASTVSDPLTDYPLLGNMSYYSDLRGKAKDHAYIYINAAYAASQKGV